MISSLLLSIFFNRISDDDEVFSPVSFRRETEINYLFKGVISS